MNYNTNSGQCEKAVTENAAPTCCLGTRLNAATCEPPPGATFKLGETTVNNCSAKDAAGNEAIGSFKVAVTITAQGFYQPVDNVPTLNSAKAGQTIPIKFEVFGES